MINSRRSAGTVALVTLAVAVAACSSDTKNSPPKGLADRAVRWESLGEVAGESQDPGLTFPDGATFDLAERRARIKDARGVHESTLGEETRDDSPWVADATGSDNIWTAGGESVFRWDGRSWKKMAALGSVIDLATVGRDDAWSLRTRYDRPTAVDVFHDGARTDLPVEADLRDLDADAPRSLWAVAERKVLHHDGTRWSDHTPSTDAHFTSIAVTPGGTVWVGTDRGYVLTLSGGTWTRSGLPLPPKVGEPGIEADPDWSISNVTADRGTVEVTAHWEDPLDGSDGIYGWYSYRTIQP